MKFTTVYYSNLWGARESRSGAGSIHGSRCVTFACEALGRAVREQGVRSLHDIPCGDLYWMRDLLPRLGDVRYVGFDIVRAVVARNRRRHPQYDFHVLDVTTEVPPAADLIFCKDLFNHLTEPDVVRAIRNMQRSGSKFLLASNNPGWENTPLSLSSGMSRHIDITAPPFNYPAPLWTVSDHVSLWRLDELNQQASSFAL